MKVLYVFYKRAKVGELKQDDELLYSFSYEKAWLSAEERFPLSIALPLREEPYSHKLALSFFENLLPEGDVREQFNRQEKIQSTFDFLERFGRDCAGAVTVSPLEKADFKGSSAGRSTFEFEVNIEDIYSTIERHESVADLLVHTHDGYLSLAGAQDKFAAVYRDGRIFIPTHSEPSTHIIKMPIWRSGVKESVYNEFYCMELARSIGLPVPACGIIPGRIPLFVTERYDRAKGEDGAITRIHQQDFCQAQGLPSELKYESRGGPSLQDNYRLILEQSPIKSRLASIHQYLDWISYNLIIGNNDSHSKNISFVLQDGSNRLAPMYDLICTAIYPKLIRDFAFRIGDRVEFSKIGKNQIAQLEAELGLRPGTFRKRLKDMSSKVISWKPAIGESVKRQYPDGKIVDRIGDLIEDRIKSLSRQGAL